MGVGNWKKDDICSYTDDHEDELDVLPVIEMETE